MNVKKVSRHRRARRGRMKMREMGATRLTVTRTPRHIYAQVIDDRAGRTLAAASSVEKDMRDASKTGANKEAAASVGKTVAERALAAGVQEVVFDRGAYRYHGRVKALADAAREAGLQF